MKVIYTIGYESKDIDSFIAQLKDAQVTLLVDSRIRRGGRKVDFCANNFERHLTKAGISYKHYKELGTPEYLMQVMKKEGHYEMSEYSKYLNKNNGILDKVVKETTDNNIALMCFELDFRKCHRSIVAAKLSDLTGAKVHHL